MKNYLLSAGLLAGLSIAAQASAPLAPVATPDAFTNAITPISNPTLHGNPLPQTNVHAMLMHQRLSNGINVGNGAATAPLGGDLNLVAVQLEYAFNERFSLIASKDGYIDFNPNNTLTEENGFANIAAGVKYAFIYDEPSQFVFSGSAVLEVPTGNRDVLQGYGDSSVNLIASALKIHDAWQFSGAAGVQLPFDTKEQSVIGFASAHVSYHVTERFVPLVELNWFRVISEGEGTGHVASSLADFEGGDLINLGSVNASANKDIVTAAIGARYKLTDRVNLGAAYEIPLTDEEANLMKSRVTLDVVWTF
ncbi:MAG: transporter [Rubritalea sp.]|uniref:transporter n=1 Tax=Rubritalea sp. TaxID=2109375 RepID=UPI0032426F80